MRVGFYSRLAFDGIRKNRRMYLPYILTCIGMVVMYYIITFLSYNETLSCLYGGETIKGVLEFGSRVIAVFACIFLFYTNSFLIRRRKKEFGLYNILGMGKRNIARIVFWEVLIVAAISLVVGLIFGFSFSKLAELGLVNIMRSDVNYTLSISLEAVLWTGIVFGMIYVLIFLNSIRQIRFSSAVSLLNSEKAGEKPPKGNWLIGIVGVILLAAAYYVAVTIEDPITAMRYFFIAVVMVIAGTYLIMISSSVLFCRLLQMKKNYYYKPNHFVSISSMVYRMKRNGAGLASICILVTMVLVMISSTSCLYFGGEDALMSRYPREIDIDIRMKNIKGLDNGNVDEIRDHILDLTKQYKFTPKSVQDYRSVLVAGFLKDNAVETDVSAIDDYGVDTLSKVYQFYFIPLSDYNEIMGTHEKLEENEALIHTYQKEYEGDTLSFHKGNTFRIKKKVEKFWDDKESAMQTTPSMTIIVPDLKKAVKGLDKLTAYNDKPMLNYRWIYAFDTGLEEEKQIDFYHDIRDLSDNIFVKGQYGESAHYCNSRAFNQDDYYAVFGGLFYLGIILSIVFIFAAVLIIYYKQISEGYEDQSRFEIMQKVGMTKREIRRSINSQLLTVFYLPLLFAAFHLAFAFPMIRKILLLFNLTNVKLFAGTTAVSVLIFAVFYMLVYRITSNAYYNIVSEVK